MIWIVDNGCSCSDHEIAFVDVPDDVPRERVIEAFTYKHFRFSDQPFVIGVADRVEWWGGGTTTFAGYVARVCHVVELAESDDGESYVWVPSEYAKKVGREFIRAAGIDVAEARLIDEDEVLRSDDRDAAHAALREFMEGKS